MILQKMMNGDSSAKKLNNRIDFSIKDLALQKDRMNFSPKEYQRFFRASNEWQQQFIKSFFSTNIIIPEFCFRFGENIPLDFKAEIMDGQQRATSIIRFIDNKIALPEDGDLEFFNLGDDYDYDLRGKHYRNLPNEVRDYYLSYELSSQVYIDLSAEEAGDRFVNVLNNHTGLNKQEKRQAITSKMSRYVQEKSRFNPYKVFQTKAGGVHLKFIHKGEHTKLDVDKTLAEIIYCVMSDQYKTKGVGGAAIDEFYKNQSRNFQHEFKTGHIDKVMNFVNQSMRGVPMAKEMISYKAFRNYCVMVSQMIKSRNKIDPINFMNAYIQTIINLKKPELRADGLTATPYELRMRGNGKEDTCVTFDLLWKEMSMVTYESTQLDEQRTFPRDVVKQAYFEQDGICAICGTRMPEFGEDIHGDHVLLYKDGNPTSPDNCDAVHASCNLRK